MKARKEIIHNWTPTDTFKYSNSGPVGNILTLLYCRIFRHANNAFSRFSANNKKNATLLDYEPVNPTSIFTI
jgi:hypothetical protein